MRRYAGEIHAVDLHRARGRDRILGRALEYRRRRPAHNRRDRRRRGRHASGRFSAFNRNRDHPRGGRIRRRDVGRYRGMAARAARRQRSYQHDHAQLRRRADAELDGARPADGTVARVSDQLADRVGRAARFLLRAEPPQSRHADSPSSSPPHATCCYSTPAPDSSCARWAATGARRISSASAFPR